MQLFSEIYILYDTYCSQLVLTKLIIGLSPDLKERFWTFPSNSALLNIIKIESLFIIWRNKAVTTIACSPSIKMNISPVYMVRLRSNYFSWICVYLKSA